MSKKRNSFEIRDYLHDILEMIAAIKEFTRNISAHEFKNDKKTVYAVIRCLEVIGEACNRIPSQIRKRFSLIPWEDIAGMRNKLVHEYFGADIEIIWHTIQEDLGSLEDIVKQIVQEISE
jgi:uncharacterized protein with HEPN domain